MNDSGNELKVRQGDGGQAANRIPSSRLQIIATAVGLAVLLVGGARFSPQVDADRANDAAAQPGIAVQTEPTTLDYSMNLAQRDTDEASDAGAQADATAPAEFIYFPAQYVNQGKEIEEYIQGF
jgi:hypothetical protein